MVNEELGRERPATQNPIIKITGNRDVWMQHEIRDPTEMDGGARTEGDTENLVRARQKMAGNTLTKDGNEGIALDVRQMMVIRCGAQSVSVTNTEEEGVLRDLGPAGALRRLLPTGTPELSVDVTDQGLLYGVPEARPGRYVMERTDIKCILRPGASRHRKMSLIR